MKCPNCGAENLDDKKACGVCGSPLKLGNVLGFKWQTRLAKQTAYIILFIDALLILVGLGFKSAADNLSNHFGEGDFTYVAHVLLNLGWLFGLLGVAGIFVAGMAYLFSLPIPKKEKEPSPSPEETVAENPKGP